LVVTDKNSIVRFCPDQNLRVQTPQRQISRFTYPDSIERIRTRRIVLADRMPQLPAQLFVEDESDRHEAYLSAPGNGLPGYSCFQRSRNFAPSSGREYMASWRASSARYSSTYRSTSSRFSSLNAITLRT